MKKLLFIIISFVSIINAQSITWQEITSKYSLPSGIKVFEGTRTSPALKVYYIDADMNNSNLAVRPYLATSSMTLPAFTSKVGAYIAINGGFFGGSTSYSTVIYPNEVKATNVQTVTRNSAAYPLIRSLFSMNKDRSFSVNWIYQFGNAMTDLYSYSQPLAYINNDPTPKPAPDKSNGKLLDNVLTGIGGAPTLVKNGKSTVTYNEEIMWGSGVGLDNGDPRTAIGYTSNKHVIMLTADGRGSSMGVSLTELASIMISLGCVDAMNLDGGGSTQMAVPNLYVNTPSEQRAVPSIFAVVHVDSLKLPKTPTFEKIIDTGDTSTTAVGGWFESANPGYWGTTKALLCPIGSGNGSYEFRLNLKKEAQYNVYGWWVSSSNRSTDVPFIIKRKGGTDTVRVDQTSNGSTWKLIGSFKFTGTTSDKVIISNAAKTNNYVVADAIKIDSYDHAATGIESNDNELPKNFSLSQNYPNPFNPSTVISYQIPAFSHVSLKVFDVLGREVATLVNEFKPAGDYSTHFTISSSFASGVYFYQIRAGNFVDTKKLVVAK